MHGLFAYSFDRETFHGNFATREAALAAAGQALRQRQDMPEGIFVGQWAMPDPQTDGHADPVLDAMRSRFQSATGESNYLSRVSEHDAADLDAALQRVIGDWLSKTGHAPRPTKVRAVSHHPVPNVLHVPDAVGERETSVMGEA
ncbi:MAG: hypothetical protein QM754_08865 [Tepidisphaeraceae bacterium]